MGAPEPLSSSTSARVGAAAVAAFRAAVHTPAPHCKQLHYGPQHAHCAR